MRPSFKTKCDFCKYHTASGCSVRPGSWYCQEALQEYKAWLSKIKNKKYKGR